MLPLFNEQKAMSVVVRLHSDHYRLFLKGASEILTEEMHLLCHRNLEFFTNFQHRSRDRGMLARVLAVQSFAVSAQSLGAQTICITGSTRGVGKGS